ncbi:MAG: glycosyltransferase [Selenomonadaceae bacterium]|nr:glycosyltransferase [Selenomonadaceae bacterium]
MNLIEYQNLLGIDKEEVNALITAKKIIGLNRSPRAEEIIVSLTSYDKRIDYVKYTIYSLLNQTFPPDKLILWLDEDSFPQREKNLPRDLLELQKFGLTIDWCENLSSYKKLIPALEKYPDAIIVTADDDIFYHPDWLKVLYEEHLKNPDCVIAHRAHRIRLDTRGNLFPYKLWQFEIKTCITPPPKRYSNFFTGAGGILYSKKFFYERSGSFIQKKILYHDVLRRELFMNLSPSADDIWFWAMTVLNGTKIVIPIAAQSKLIYVDIDRELGNETLGAKNVGEGKNDIQLRQVIEKYPAVLEILIREAADFKPYLSVIMLVEDVRKLNACLQNIFAQRFPDFELIVVNCGSRVEIPNPPTNFKIIHYPGGSELDAFNLGLQKAAGEYILFKDADSFLTASALDNIAQLAINLKADVIHFAGHLKDDKFIFDDALKFEINAPIFFEETKQNRAAFWLQGKLNNRLATKIFNREFLMQHKINFEGGLTEFMFQALIYAKKYLLVPQAFCKCKD